MGVSVGVSVGDDVGVVVAVGVGVREGGALLAPVVTRSSEEGVPEGV